jgi:hypothetical protein
MKRLIFLLLIFIGLGVAPAMAGDCDGIYGANQVCGSVAGGAPGPIAFSTVGRTPLTGNISYYVNGNSSGTAACGPTGGSTCSAGSDSNNCLTPTTACLTAQRPVNFIINNIDAAGFVPTIYLAHGSNVNYSFSCTGGPVIGQSSFIVSGDGNAPTAVTIVPPALSSAIAVKDGCTVEIQHFAFADNGTNNGVSFISTGVGGFGHVDMNDITFGSMTIGTQITASYSSSVTATGSLTISGGANAALTASNGGVIDFGSQTVTVSGTPAFGTAFAFMINGGVINATSTTFSGAATGPRCIIDGPLNVSGYNPNAVFPGNTNCVQNEYVGAIGLQQGSGGSSTFGYGAAGQCLTSGGASTSLDVWANCAGAGVPQNNLNTQSGNYTIQTTDCGFTINETGAQKTITLPSVSGFATNCVLAVYNANSTRGQILSGFPGAVAATPTNILWPLDTITVQIVNGAWTIQSYVNRHKLTASITVFVDNTNGADTNDCLATTTGACKTIQGALNYVNTWDGNTQAIAISVADGTYTNNVTQNGPFHGNPTVTLTGDLATPANALISTTSADGIDLTNGAILTLGGFKIVTTTGGSGIVVSNGSFLSITGAMNYGAIVGAQLTSKTGSTITIGANYTISGSAASHWSAIQGGQIIAGSHAITVSGTPAFSTAFAQSISSVIGAASATYSGSATGPSFAVLLNGVIANNGSSALPGSVSTSTVATHGYVTVPGTPAISSCGGSPSAATGTDFSGSVTEGTTATGCTITFATGSTFVACTVSLSTGAAVGISTLGATLVVTHASLSNNVLYWQCS